MDTNSPGKLSGWQTTGPGGVMSHMAGARGAWARPGAALWPGAVHLAALPRAGWYPDVEAGTAVGAVAWLWATPPPLLSLQSRWAHLR